MGTMGAAPTLANNADPAEFYTETLAILRHLQGHLDENNVKKGTMTDSNRILESQLKFDARASGWGHRHISSNTFDAATEFGIKPMRRHIDTTTSKVVWNDLFGKCAGVYIQRGRSLNVVPSSGQWLVNGFSSLESAVPYGESRPFTSDSVLQCIPLVTWYPSSGYSMTGDEAYWAETDTHSGGDFKFTSDVTDILARGCGFDNTRIDVFLTLVIFREITED